MLSFEHECNPTKALSQLLAYSLEFASMSNVDGAEMAMVLVF